ncbi:FimV/HubP family polar landmark protein [Halomonas sp. E19]|uniref:FimV/HubP family polar landmark protein n=1 Tax=Halomonas sp. E19 TaxID=3397247 RepID=UPI004034DB8D
MRSTLQMPLHAVIPLTDTVGLEPGLLRVSMASARDFEAAGLVRTPLVTGIRTAVNQAQGQWRVELASEGAITEPWLDLLLRFDWPGGQQLREVTLLLDPPGYDQLPVLVQAPVSVSVPPSPTTVASSPSSRPVGAAARTPTGTAWVASGDTLWNVATRLRPDSGISMDQMMIALVEANPEVFPSGNINAMRAGFALNVPSREAIAARTAQESREIVLAMNQAWAQRGRGAPVSVPLGGATSAVAMASAAPGTVEAVPPAPDTGTAASQAAPGDAPQLVQPEPEPRLTLLSDAELAAEGEAAPAPATDLAEQAAVEQEPTLPVEEQALSAEEQRLAELERRWQASQDALAEVRVERDALQQELGGLREQMEAMREQLALLLAGEQARMPPGRVACRRPHRRIPLVGQCLSGGRGAKPGAGRSGPCRAARSLALGAPAPHGPGRSPGRLYHLAPGDGRFAGDSHAGRYGRRDEPPSLHAPGHECDSG